MSDEVKLAVTVKPLRWRGVGDRVSEATTPFGDYQIAYYEERGEGAGWAVIFCDNDEVGHYPTDIIAMSMAQRHYEQRILSALSPAPEAPGTGGAAAVAAYIEALTPSVGTKAEYIGEFTIAVERFLNEDDEPDDDGPVDPYDHIQVPWTTIKQIMAAISARAERFPTNPAETQADEVGRDGVGNDNDGREDSQP